MRRFLPAVVTVFALYGCGERRAFPEERFLQIAARCEFKSVTYQHDGSSDPIIDFSQEQNSTRALACFDEADLQLKKEDVRDPNPDLGVTFVYDVVT